MFFNKVILFFSKYLKGEDGHNHFFLESPINVITVLLIYLLFVIKWGPQIMKKKDAYNLKRLMVIYNVAQVVLNLRLFIMVAQLTPRFSIYCSPMSTSNSEIDVAIRKVHYYYTLLKFLDLFDTVIHVLRKKYNQISFLHIHHHFGIALTTWITLKHVPGGVIFFIFIANTFVHVVMYFYYLVSLFNSAKIIWWKKYLTQLQLVQHFFILFVFFTHLLNSECAYPGSWLVYYLLNVALTIYLFSKFYLQHYILKNKSK